MLFLSFPRPLSSSPSSCATVYRIGLRVGKNERFLVNEWKLESQGTFYQAQVCGPIVAAAAAILGPTSYTHQIHLFNTNTGTKLVLEPPDMKVCHLRRFDTQH